MDFIRWVIFKMEPCLFKGGMFVPFFGANAVLCLALFGAVNAILGLIAISLSIIFWGLIAYVLISREVKKFYAKYEKEKEQKMP